MSICNFFGITAESFVSEIKRTCQFNKDAPFVSFMDAINVRLKAEEIEFGPDVASFIVKRLNCAAITYKDIGLTVDEFSEMYGPKLSENDWLQNRRFVINHFVEMSPPMFENWIKKILSPFLTTNRLNRKFVVINVQEQTVDGVTRLVFVQQSEFPVLTYMPDPPKITYIVRHLSDYYVSDELSFSMLNGLQTKSEVYQKLANGNDMNRFLPTDQSSKISSNNNNNIKVETIDYEEDLTPSESEYTSVTQSPIPEQQVKQPEIRSKYFLHEMAQLQGTIKRKQRPKARVHRKESPR